MTCANPKRRQLSRPFRAQANTMITKLVYDGWLAVDGPKLEDFGMFALFIQKIKRYHRIAATLYLPA